MDRSQSRLLSNEEVAPQRTSRNNCQSNFSSGQEAANMSFGGGTTALTSTI